jgi:hypothetical protein
MTDDDECGAVGEWEFAAETEVLGENLSTTNPTRPDLGSNPGHRGGKPANNRLSYNTATHLPIIGDPYVIWSDTRR